MDIALSSGCFLDPLTASVLLHQYSWQQEIASQAGIHAIEMWPIKWGPALSLRKTDARGISSFHQSSSRETLRRPSLYAFKAILSLPERDHSLHQLIRMHQCIGERPTILYPNQDKTQRLDVLTQYFPRRAIQFDPETAYAWDAPDMLHFYDIAEEMGFNYFCVDTTHIRRETRGDKKPSPWVSWELPLRALMKERNEQVSMCHLSIGRLDSIDQMPQTLDDVVAVIHRDETSDIMRLLRTLHEEGFHGLLTIEVLPSAIWQIYERLYGSRPRTFSHEVLIRALSDIRATCEYIFLS